MIILLRRSLLVCLLRLFGVDVRVFVFLVHVAGIRIVGWWSVLNGCFRHSAGVIILVKVGLIFVVGGMGLSNGSTSANELTFCGIVDVEAELKFRSRTQIFTTAYSGTRM